MSNISAKKSQNAFTYVKVIANQSRDVFETQCILVLEKHLAPFVMAAL